jgi:DNA topoisomerase-1
LGEHPDGGKIEVKSGRYGPYVTHNKINATLPKGREPTELTVQEAIDLLAARAAKAGNGKKPARKSKAPTKKAAAKKPAAKKATAKKTTAKKTAAKKTPAKATSRKAASGNGKAEAS